MLAPSTQNTLNQVESFTCQGFHGTNAAYADSILKKGFKSSHSEADLRYLGHGAYFFIDGGISDVAAKEQAKQHAILNAWDNNTRQKVYTVGCVIRAEIICPKVNVLDLREPAELKAYNEFKHRYLEKLRRVKNATMEQWEGTILTQYCKELDFRVVIHHMIIKLEKSLRVGRIPFSVPNCTVLAVQPGFENTYIPLTTLSVLPTFDIP